MAAATAVVDALRSVGAQRISVASPYEAWLNEKLKEYLNMFGIEVTALKGLGTQEHASFTPEQNAELAVEVDRPESQAIFISCSNFRTLEMIEIMEKKLGKPVLTSNMCSLWKMLRRLGDSRCLPGTGLLFRNT